MEKYFIFRCRFRLSHVVNRVKQGSVQLPECSLYAALHIHCGFSLGKVLPCNGGRAVLGFLGFIITLAQINWANVSYSVITARDLRDRGWEWVTALESSEGFGTPGLAVLRKGCIPSWAGNQLYWNCSGMQETEHKRAPDGHRWLRREAVARKQSWLASSLHSGVDVALGDSWDSYWVNTVVKMGKHTSWD